MLKVKFVRWIVCGISFPTSQIQTLWIGGRPDLRTQASVFDELGMKLSNQLYILQTLRKIISSKHFGQNLQKSFFLQFAISMLIAFSI